MRVLRCSQRQATFMLLSAQPQLARPAHAVRTLLPVGAFEIAGERDPLRAQWSRRAP
jgi:hypothetical protein